MLALTASTLPIVLVLLFSTSTLRRNRATIRLLLDTISEQSEYMDAQSDHIRALTQQLLTPLPANSVLMAASEYMQKWQDTEPMSPAAVAGVCEMVIDHLHLSIKDLHDENVATTILTCCEVLDQMRSVAEDDQEAIDAALEAWETRFE